MKFEKSEIGSNHEIESRNVLCDKETGRVVAVFYNDYDLDDVITHAINLEKRNEYLAAALSPRQVVIKPHDELKRALLDYDDWSGDMPALQTFLVKYEGQNAEIFEKDGDYFILDDNDVVMPRDSFDFVNN